MGAFGLYLERIMVAVVDLSIAAIGIIRSNTGKMQVTVTKEGSVAVLKLAGRFDFNSHREFRAAIEPLEVDGNLRAVTIDFSGVEYLDSSALGMLLMLRDNMIVAKKEVTFSGVHGNVKQVLDIANFGKLFHID
jgi:HptB-dependent secretion and biofilm anti anti-sigma factor